MYRVVSPLNWTPHSSTLPRKCVVNPLPSHSLALLTASSKAIKSFDAQSNGLLWAKSLKFSEAPRNVEFVYSSFPLVPCLLYHVLPVLSNLRALTCPLLFSTDNLRIVLMLSTELTHRCMSPCLQTCSPSHWVLSSSTTWTPCSSKFKAVFATPAFFQQPDNQALSDNTMAPSYLPCLSEYTFTAQCWSRSPSSSMKTCVQFQIHTRSDLPETCTWPCPCLYDLVPKGLPPLKHSLPLLPNV